ncbi:MAG TPA: HEAT repeat domain-containing protein [Vicinamibacterales bacterium]|nr:HEAT repeat domain-containing protein [Vicinamibacterales bacterium]
MNAQRPSGGAARRTAAAVGCVIAASVFVATADARAAWVQLAQLLSLQGKPEPASANLLSEHHLEALDGMPPQAQAEFLLERAINHYANANREIEARLASWRGKLQQGERYESLFRMAINSDDLRVRAAAIEINILVRGLDKSAATVDRLEPLARTAPQGPRANALWDLGLLGGRGVEPQRVAGILLASIHDENVNVRYWAVEGLAYLATDDTIEPLLRIFHDDPSPMIRERAACSLAQSGMLTRAQRMIAVPTLIDYAADMALDEQTRGWVFQALRDITGESLGRDPAAWRAWWGRQR